MIIFRYLTKEVLSTLLATTLILMVLFITNQSVQFLNRAATGQIPATELLQLIVLQIPLMLGYLLPLGLYLGVLLSFGRLYLDSEMTVLFACGLSRAQLIKMVLTIAAGVSMIVAWLMVYIVPVAQGDINYIFSKAAVTASVAKVIPGRFMTFGSPANPIVFYAKTVEDHQLMRHVFFAKKVLDGVTPGIEKWGVIIAKSAVEKEIPAQHGQYLIFKDGTRYVGMPGKKSYEKMQFSEYGVRLTSNQIPAVNAVQYYSIAKLWSLYDKDRQAAAELQWRIAMPISTLIFALLAVPLGEVRPRYGKFTQLFPAMLLYVGYADLIFLSRAWMRSGKLSTAVGMWWVHAAALLLAFILIAYRVGWRRIKLSLRRVVVR